MPEPLLPIDELRRLPFSIASLVQLVGTSGSYERENAENIARGIRERLEWVIANLEKAQEGQQNFGLLRTFTPEPEPKKGPRP